VAGCSCAHLAMTDEGKPSLLEQLRETVSSPSSTDKLAEKLSADWAWAQKLLKSSPDNTLRQQITSSRTAIQDAVDKAQSSATKVQDTIEWMQTPSEVVNGYKAKALEVRGKYPATICGVITTMAIVPPALRRAPFGVARNLVLAGGVSSALLYPEFFFRMAPKISSAASKVEQQVKERVIGK